MSLKRLCPFQRGKTYRYIEVKPYKRVKYRQFKFFLIKNSTALLISKLYCKWNKELTVGLLVMS